MKVVGNNYLSISDQTGLSFYINISTDNTNGSCDFGFTGENFINFKLSDGKLFDHENRSSFTYKQNEIFNISGQINNGNYGYYINDQPACFNGKSNLNKISGFYINATNCQPEIDLKIYAKKPDYNLLIDNLYYIISGNSLSGSIISNNSFKIYSGEVLAPTGFFIESISKNINSNIGGSILINAYNQTRDQISSERTYPLGLKLYTNFGEIIKSFEITGSFSGFLNINLNFIDINYGTETGVGLYKNDIILLNASIESGDLRSTSIYLDKYIDVEFDYYGGNTGDINYNVFASGYKFLNVSGVISGSGYLGLTDLNLTGYDIFSGTQITGYSSGSVNELFIITGNVRRNITSIMTGYHFDAISIQSYSSLLTGFAYDGNLYYNGPIYRDKERNIISSYRNVNNALSDGYGNFLGTTSDNLISNESGTFVLLSAPYSPNTGFIQSTGKVLAYTGINGFLKLARVYSGLFYDHAFGDNIYIDRTGDSFAISSRRVGAQNQTGRFYIFNNYTQAVSSAKTIDITGSRFGIALAGDTIYLGRPESLNMNGVVDIYKYNGLNFVLNTTLTGYSAGGWFGDCLTVTENNSLLAVSAPFANASGNIYMFSNQNNNYSFLGVLQRSGNFAAGIDGFGVGPKDCLSFNKNGNIFAAGGWNANNNSGIVYIFTGNINNPYKQVNYIIGDSVNQFGSKVRLNNNGNTLMATSSLENFAYIYTGILNNWKKDLVRVPQYGGFSSNAKLYEMFNFLDKEGFYQGYSPPVVQTFVNILHSGYFSGLLTATGIINKSNNYLVTGLITGNKYTKTFGNSFVIESGYYISGVSTGLNNLNLISNESYASYNAFFNKDINTISIIVKSRNYPETDEYLTGLLKITSRNIENSKSGIIYQYITGG